MAIALPASSIPPILALIRDQAAREAEFGRWPLLLPVLSAGGVWFAAEGPAPALPSLPLAVAALLLAMIAAYGLRRSMRLAALAPAAFALAAFLAGIVSLTIAAERHGVVTLTRSASAALTGRIVTVEPRGGRQRIVLDVESAQMPGEPPKRVRLTLSAKPLLKVGQTVELRARLFPLRGPVRPGGYDPARRLYFDGIGATGYVYGNATVLAPPDGGFSAAIGALRAGVIERVLAAGGSSGPLAVALLTGERGLMDAQDVEALRASGLGHILAISGLHMALVAGSVFGAVRLLLALVPGAALRFPIKKWAAVAGVMAATFYLALSGGSVATVRAYVMLLIALLAVIADRPALTMRAVAFAAALLIAIDPVSVLEPGFQMSFLAVIALVGAYEWWSGRPKERGRPRRSAVVVFFVGLAATSIIAGLATSPVAATHFHRITPLGLPANLAAMPALTLVAMPAGVLSLAAMPFGLEAVPLQVMNQGLLFIVAVAHRIAEWTGDSGLTGSVNPFGTLLICGGLIWLAVMTARWRLAGVVAIAAGLAIAPAARPDLLVADDGRSVAARGPDGRLALLPGTSQYAGASFLKADGDGRGPHEAEAGRCDTSGCVLPLGAGLVAVPATLVASTEDCRLATVVATLHRVPACAPAFLVDREVLKKVGSVALRQTSGGFVIRGARPAGHRRPWHIPAELRRAP